MINVKFFEDPGVLDALQNIIFQSFSLKFFCDVRPLSIEFRFDFGKFTIVNNFRIQNIHNEQKTKFFLNKAKLFENSAIERQRTYGIKVDVVTLFYLGSHL